MERNLLILGAGQYGMLVREIALATGEFSRVGFLDDRSDGRNQDILGRIEEYPRFSSAYQYAFVAIGADSALRLALLNRLAEAGYRLAVLVHPRAYVSPSAVLGAGTIVEPMAVVHTHVSVADGCIISAGAVVNHNASLGAGVHCDCNSVVCAGASVPGGIKVFPGEVYHKNEQR